MYQYTISDQAIYTFKNPSTGNHFTIAPKHGAVLTEVHLNNISILDPIDIETELADNPFYKNVLLFPFPNRIRDGKYSFEDKQYQFAINDTDKHNALHGFCKNAIFSVSEIKCEATKCSISCIYKYGGQYETYPFPCVLAVTYSLCDQAGLSIKINCTNTGNTAMPIGLGWHPYFQLDTPIDELYLQLPKVQHLPADQQMIPTGAQVDYPNFEQLSSLKDIQLDDGFVILNKKENQKIRLVSKKYQLELSAQNPLENQYLQVFTPPHRQSIAIEPMTCAANAFNNRKGFITLAVQSTWSFSFTIAASKRIAD